MSYDLKPQQTRLLADFSKKQKQILDEWSEKAQQAFLDMAKKYTEEMYTANMVIIDHNDKDSFELVNTAESLFRTYTQQRGLVKHQQKIQYCVARKHFFRNFIKSAFMSWRKQSKFQKYIRQMNAYCIKYNNQRLPRQIFSKWKTTTRQSVRAGILQQVNRRTDQEIQKMQKEYEALISQLEGVLEKRLIELKVEEEQHKEIVNRYEGIVEKRTLASRH